MSRVVNYTEAASWPEDEVEANLEYLDTRGRIWEKQQAEAILAGDAPGDTPAEEVSSPVADEVPSGKIDEIMAWVGGDKEKAGQALDKELESDKPRTTLLDALEALTEAE